MTKSKSIFGLALLALASVSTLIQPEGAAAAQPYYVVYGTHRRLEIRSAPTLHSGVLDYFRLDGRIRIVCQSLGGPVDGYRVWDKVNFPVNGWVTDRYVSTPNRGRFSPSVPQCVGEQEQRAINWAKAQVGKTKQPNGTPWALWCDKFVASAFGLARSNYASAGTHYRDLKRHKQIRFDRQPPAGAMVFYDSPYGGHVALSLGGGKIITTSSKAYIAVHYARLSDFPNYLGWALMPSEYKAKLPGLFASYTR